MECGFYKFEDGNLLFAPNFVDAPEFTLDAINKNELNLPLDGWYWFESKQEAKDYFNIE